MRGQYSLFNDLIQPKQVVISSATRKGRSYKLMRERNECLLHRYYFYIKINENQYADVIAILSSEFFLSQERVIICLNQNIAKLKEILAKEPGLRELKNTYPFLSW